MSFHFLVSLALATLVASCAGSQREVRLALKTSAFQAELISPAQSPSNFKTLQIKVSNIPLRGQLQIFSNASCQGKAIGTTTVQPGSSVVTAHLDEATDGEVPIHMLLQARDGTTTECSPALIRYALDTAPPQIEAPAASIAPTRLAQWNWACQGTGSPDSCTYQILIDQNADSIPSGLFSNSTSAIQASGSGPFFLHIIAQDAAGNLSSVAHFSAVLDNTAPNIPDSITLIEPASSPGNDSSPSVRVSGVQAGDLVSIHSDSSCSTLSLKASGVVASGSSSIDLTSSNLSVDGSYSFYARATDSLGNASNCSSSTAPYILDTLAPTAPVLALQDPVAQATMTYSDATPRFVVNSVTAGDIITLHNAASTDCSAAPLLTAIVPAGSTSVTLPETFALSEATHFFRARASDSAGNSTCSSASVQYTLVLIQQPQIAYVPALITLTKGVAISPAILPQSSGGPIDQCSIVGIPATLPAGLSLSATTCAISGTPTQLMPVATGYTIQASNGSASGPFSTSIGIRVVDIPPSISFASLTIANGSTISPSVVPSNSGGAIESCVLASGSPALPTGVSLNSNTCEISGTPTQPQQSTSHTITAINSGGSSSATFNLKVHTNPVLQYANTLHEGEVGFQGFWPTGTAKPATSGAAIVPTLLDDRGYPITACQISSGNIGTGISVDSATCQINGTPTSARQEYTYQVTARNQFGISAPASVRLKLWALDPQLDYSGVNQSGQSGYSGEPFVLFPSRLSSGNQPTVDPNTFLPGFRCRLGSGFSMPTGFSFDTITCAVYTSSAGVITSPLTIPIEASNLNRSNLVVSSSLTLGTFKTRALLYLSSDSDLYLEGANASSSIHRVTVRLDTSLSDPVTVFYKLIKPAIPELGALSNISGDPLQNIELEEYGTVQISPFGTPDVPANTAYIDFRHFGNDRDDGNKLVHVVLLGSDSDQIKINRTNESMGKAGIHVALLADDDGSNDHLNPRFLSITTGAEHTCGITYREGHSTGPVRCWGSNSYQKLGIGLIDTVDHPLPSAPGAIDGGTLYRKIAAGWSHTCGLTEGGEVRCWGSNTNRALGLPTSTLSSLPTRIPGGKLYRELSVGQGHACAIVHAPGDSTDGILECWGHDQFGKLGIGPSTSGGSAPTPVQPLDPSIRFSAVAAAVDHTCALSTGGRIYCWGRNQNGELGLGEMITLTRDRPTEIFVAEGITFESLSSGTSHSCAKRTVIAGSNPEFWCWGGYNNQKELGRLTSGSGGVASHTPAPTTFQEVFQDMVVRGHTTCGIEAGGRTKCWGSTYSLIEDRFTVASFDLTSASSNPYLDGSKTLLAISPSLAYQTHLCTITSEHRARCSGGLPYYVSQRGQLGDGRMSRHESPTPSTVIQSDEFDLITRGKGMTCGRVRAPAADQGMLRCWGENPGDGTRHKSVPVPVDFGTPYRSISAGESHTCGVTEAGLLKCWGKLPFIGIGAGPDGDTSGGGVSISSTWSPMQVDSGSLYQAVSAAKTHTCAILAEDHPLYPARIKCWGSQSAALGNGSTGTTTEARHRVPQLIQDGGAARYRRVSAGNGYTCAITDSFKLKCWGENLDGRLGTSSLSSTAVPQDVDPSEDYTEVYAGHLATCGLTRLDGTLKCWGNSGYIGRGTAVTPAHLPSPVASSLKFKTIAWGIYHGCAISMAGQLYCWGSDSGAALGNGPGDVPMMGPNFPSTPSDGGAHTYLTEQGALALQDNSSLALTSDGEVLSWGSLRGAVEVSGLGNYGDGRPVGRFNWVMGE